MNQTNENQLSADELEEVTVKGMNKVGNIGIEIYTLLDSIKSMKYLNHYDMKMALEKGEQELLEVEYHFIKAVKETYDEIVILEDQRKKTIEEYNLASTVSNIYFTSSTQSCEEVTRKYEELSARYESSK